MNIFDLLVYGIEAQMSNEEKFMDDAIVFHFRKGDLHYQRVIQRQEIMGFQGGAISSSLLEDHICREVMAYFKGIKKSDKPTLKLGDWVICNESGVVGRIINFYTPTSCEEQIMVKTRDGRRYHAPTRLWKHYQFGFEASTVIMDEGASLLNPHGQYATKFAENHGISINEALEHPTVKAHEVYFNSVIGEQVLKEIYPKQDALKNGG